MYREARTSNTCNNRVPQRYQRMTIGKRPNVILEVDGLNAILNLVKEGMGHAILPSYTLSNFENASPFSIKTIHSPAIKSQLMLVWSSRRPTTQTQKKAMEVVTQVLLQAIARAVPVVR